MKILKYPEYKHIHCSMCGCDFEINRLDFKKKIIKVGDDGEIYCNCPVCSTSIILGKESKEKVIYEDLKNIFNARAVVVNNLPANETRKEIAHQLNGLYSEVLDYFKDKYSLEESSNEDD